MALLLSANELFLDKGYDAVSLDDIVQHAGGSKASIYKYFGNKEGLFTAICDYRRELFLKIFVFLSTFILASYVTILRIHSSISINT